MLWKRAVDTTSIRDRGKLGLPDHEVLRHAVEEDRVIVTANADDFIAICGDVELHPGLVTIASGARDQQLAMISAALDHIDHAARAATQLPRDFMVNRIVEVGLDLQCVDFPLPA